MRRCTHVELQRFCKGKGARRGEEEERMITEEQLGNMDAEMNSEQEVLKEQGLGHEPNAQDDDQHSAPPPLPPPVPQPVDDECSAVSTSKADEKEEAEDCGECLRENLESTLEKSEVFAGDSVKDIEVVAVSTENLGSKSEKPETLDDQHSIEEGEVVDTSPMKEEEHAAAPAPNSPRVSLQVDVEEGSLTADENSHVSPQGLSNALPVQDEGALLVSSPSGKRRSKGRPWKKNGGKKKSDKEVGELPVVGVGGASHSRDAGTQTDPQELQMNANESDPSGIKASENIDDRHRVAEGQEQPTLKSSTSEQQVRNEEVLHECESPSAVLGHEGVDVVEEERHDKVDPSLASFKALRSFGRWADVSEEVETRATDTEPDSLAIVDEGVDKQGQELRGKTDQGFERPQGLDITSDASPNDPTENEFRGNKQQAVEVSPREDVRESPRSKYTEPELRGKSHQGFESPRSRHDLRADSWNNHKEDLRGKTQQSRDRDSLSQASRESNWRRKPVEPRVRQDMPRSTGKLGLDGDTKKDEHQDFRSRSQYSAEPQATHKNWIPRRGLHSRGEGEGRAEQSKARGKGKQGREVEPQNQFSKDSARQKFEADLRIKQDELLQRSKQSLKAEFQKAKRIEQARKGGDQLEMELNKNLVYEDGNVDIKRNLENTLGEANEIQLSQFVQYLYQTL